MGHNTDEFFRPYQPQLVFCQISGCHQQACCNVTWDGAKNPVNRGINYQPQLVHFTSHSCQPSPPDKSADLESLRSTYRKRFSLNNRTDDILPARIVGIMKLDTGKPGEIRGFLNQTSIPVEYMMGWDGNGFCSSDDKNCDGPLLAYGIFVAYKPEP